MKCKSILIINRVIIFSIPILFLMMACSKENNGSSKTFAQRIVVVKGTKDLEILDDLQNSINNLNDYFVKKDIHIIYKDTTGWSGYILENGSNKKVIKSIMTDIDLLNKCKEYFVNKTN
jgi:hypothetical protein